MQVNGGMQLAFIARSLTPGSVNIDGDVTFEQTASNDSTADPVLLTGESLKTNPMLGTLTVNADKSSFAG
jgi:hypothetical protein